MAPNKKTNLDREDEERAEAEGMNSAADKPAQNEAAPKHLLQTPEFLDQVIEEFYEDESSLATIEDAAAAMTERLAMSEFAEALEKDTEGKLREYIQDHLNAEEWRKLENEELDRQMLTDKNIDGATPG
ncbi:MAG: hypothetical protein DWG76_04395 [Chloroflexi bacterium]|nr:hypothetical protein [Chloroflexota bacterium]